jgi:hypothetical protein
MLRTPTLPVRVLQAIRKSRKWLNNDEARWLFCVHPATPVADALAETALLSEARLREMDRNMKVRRPIRMKASELLSSRKRRR